MPKIAPSVPSALAAALTNDKKGVVSKKDADKIVYAGIKAIFASSEPEATFEANSKYMFAAGALVGSDPKAAKTLAAYQKRGAGAVASRLGQITGETQLPLALRAEFIENLVDHEVAENADAVSISKVKGSQSGGFQFDYSIAGGETQKAFANRYDGGFVLAPVKLTKTALNAATETMQAYFDEYFAPDMADYGDSAADIAEMRASIAPERAKFPGEYSDPYNYVADYPVVLVMANPTGSDHGFFVGIDPANTDDVDAYDFN